jgi:hypothetical protein
MVVGQLEVIKSTGSLAGACWPLMAECVNG